MTCYKIQCCSVEHRFRVLRRRCLFFWIVEKEPNPNFHMGGMVPVLLETFDAAQVYISLKRLPKKPLKQYWVTIAHRWI